MKTVPVETLTRESFSEFGSFRDMLNPMSEKLGAPPVELFRDMLAQSLGVFSSASYSNCRVEPRAFVIDSSEHHNATMEMLMPLDGDTLMHFAPAFLPKTGLAK
jgi:ureidoglycolate lyase